MSNCVSLWSWVAVTRCCTYRELGLDLGECVSSNSVADLEVGVALLGQDGGTLVVGVLGGGQGQGRGGEEENGSLDIHLVWF